jgi:hypothetical protein
MILPDSEVASLKSALGCWERFGYIATAVVGLGCVGEFIAEFTSLFPTERSKQLAKLSLLVLILGIAGELLSAVRTSQLSGQIIAHIEQRAADAEQKAAAATLEAAIANRAASEAKEGAAILETGEAQLQKDAEDERLARAKIEAAVAFRQLTEVQKYVIGTAVKGFSSVAVASVWFNASTTEAELFADDISEALQLGHIRVQPASGLMELRENSSFGDSVKQALTGVVIQSTKHDGAQKFAALMVEELNRIGFDAVRQTNPPFDDKPVPQIWINVEPRPKGPQGEYKLRAEEDLKRKNTTKNAH